MTEGEKKGEREQKPHEARHKVESALIRAANCGGGKKNDPAFKRKEEERNGLIHRVDPPDRHRKEKKKKIPRTTSREGGGKGERKKKKPGPAPFVFCRLRGRKKERGIKNPFFCGQKDSIPGMKGKRGGKKEKKGPGATRCRSLDDLRSRRKNRGKNGPRRGGEKKKTLSL